MYGGLSALCFSGSFNIVHHLICPCKFQYVQTCLYFERAPWKIKFWNNHFLDIKVIIILYYLLMVMWLPLWTQTLRETAKIQPKDQNNQQSKKKKEIPTWIHEDLFSILRSLWHFHTFLLNRFLHFLFHLCMQRKNVEENTINYPWSSIRLTVHM